MTFQPHRSGQPGMTDRFLAVVRGNPEGLLLLAAGCALLLRGRSPSVPTQNAYGYGPKDRQPTPTRYGNGLHPASADGGVQRYTSNVADKARDMAANASEQVEDSVRSVASSATEYAHDVTRQASEYAQDAYGQASDYAQRFTAEAHSTFRNTVDYLVRERPLVIAVAGLAAGAAVAAAFRPTEFEKDALRPVGAKMSEVIEETGDKVKETAAKAGERLKKAVDDPSKLKDSVSGIMDDVSEAFDKSPGESAGSSAKEGSHAHSRPTQSSGGSSAPSSGLGSQPGNVSTGGSTQNSPYGRR
jgi:ElaB/YqjD/DUF883 family membrane-anchored ribosome-binding protein